MAWELSRWLVLMRMFQLMGAMASGGLNGFLAAFIYSRKLGFSQNMMVLEFLICVLLVYTSLALIIQHTGQRSRRTAWLTTFIVADVIFLAMDLGIISLLAQAGVPSNCAGLTRQDFTKDDKPNQPAPGYTTIRFSNESSGQLGELDKYCAFERSYYFIAIGLVFTYIVTIVLTILRICEKNYTRNSRVNELLDALERANEKADAMSPLSSSPYLTPPVPPAPSSEGIITRNTSVRSNVTNFTAVTSSTASSHGPSYGPRPPLLASNRMPARRPLSQYSSIPPVPPRRPSMPSSPPRLAGLGLAGHQSGQGFVPVPLHEEEDRDSVMDDSAAQAALVSDGMQHHPSQPQHQQQQQQQQQQQYHQIYHHPSQMRMPMLAEDEEQQAEAALVSDGIRPSEPMLPPYEPGSSSMPGHGANESNEMRLSEYVKGETRAQHMKDSGRY
ncbi:hypothetical protein QBC46DRAFT_94979 [Diplogelasinospora grovesii]|uniref:Uncharacterized protein n=1 Tax=Diplogelasinospora grovesii TaxID=303347 RepID=A0AAN6NHG7_9PEZI|nr:hypothetical protein QBC46DRAFT_94979 [Diplogelasinospora grovesii]